MVAAVGWTLLAFGGFYFWALAPSAAIAALGILAVRPSVFRKQATLDWLLALSVLCVLFQTLPLPASLHTTLSPHAGSVEGALQIQTPDPEAFRSLSIRPDATIESVAWLAVVVLVFWTARSVFERARPGSVVRPIALIGIVVSATAVVQLATTPKLIYGFWPAEDAAAMPFGPFVNRNHMATWLIMAIPLVCGYAMTHIRARTADLPDRQLAVARALDPTTIWQIGAVLTMTSTLFLSLSRSGVIGLLAATAFGVFAGQRKGFHVRARWVVGAAILLLFAATYLANFDALADRFASALDHHGTKRIEIWRQTIPIVRDFTWTGTGVGTFNRAMLVYQEGDRSLLFNQAHNHYLQIVAEGGLLVSIPAYGALVALLALALKQLRRESSAIFWSRAGATSALAAVGVQSIWETGLCMPANSMLLAVCAALAVHDVEARRRVREGAIVAS